MKASIHTRLALALCTLITSPFVSGTESATRYELGMSWSRSGHDYNSERTSYSDASRVGFAIQHLRESDIENLTLNFDLQLARNIRNNPTSSDFNDASTNFDDASTNVELTLLGFYTASIKSLQPNTDTSSGLWGGGILGGALKFKDNRLGRDDDPHDGYFFFNFSYLRNSGTPDNGPETISYDHQIAVDFDVSSDIKSATARGTLRFGGEGDLGTDDGCGFRRNFELTAVGSYTNYSDRSHAQQQLEGLFGYTHRWKNSSTYLNASVGIGFLDNYQGDDEDLEYTFAGIGIRIISDSYKNPECKVDFNPKGGGLSSGGRPHSLPSPYPFF